MRQINTISVVKWSICRIWINNKIFNIGGRLVGQRYTITRVTQYKKKSLWISWCKVWNISSNENKNQFSQIIAFICVKTKVYNDPSKRFFLHGLPLFTKYKKLKWTILSYNDTVTSAKGILHNKDIKGTKCTYWYYE
jgi:hypothetical protein